MQEFLIQAGTILVICSPTAAIIALSIHNGDFFQQREANPLPDELEIRRRDNETMLRHERRAAHAAAMKSSNNC